jgi:hypothetical protein
MLDFRDMGTHYEVWLHIQGYEEKPSRLSDWLKLQERIGVSEDTEQDEVPLPLRDTVDFITSRIRSLDEIDPTTKILGEYKEPVESIVEESNNVSATDTVVNDIQDGQDTYGSNNDSDLEIMRDSDAALLIGTNSVERDSEVSDAPEQFIKNDREEEVTLIIEELIIAPEKTFRSTAISEHEQEEAQDAMQTVNSEISQNQSNDEYHKRGIDSYLLEVIDSVKPQNFHIDDIEKVIAAIEGQTDVKDWLWIAKLNTGKYLAIQSSQSRYEWDDSVIVKLTHETYNYPAHALEFFKGKNNSQEDIRSLNKQIITGIR